MKRKISIALLYIYLADLHELQPFRAIIKESRNNRLPLWGPSSLCPLLAEHLPQIRNVQFTCQLTVSQLLQTGPRQKTKKKGKGPPFGATDTGNPTWLTTKRSDPVDSLWTESESNISCNWRLRNNPGPEFSAAAPCKSLPWVEHVKPGSLWLNLFQRLEILWMDEILHHLRNPRMMIQM